MSMCRESLLRDSVEKVFREALSSTFSSDFYQIFVFHVSRGLGGDLFDVFLKDPIRVYSRIEEVYGFGVIFIFRMLYDYIRARMELSLSFDRFLDIVRSGDREALRSIFAKLSDASRSGNPYLSNYSGGVNV